MPNQYGSQQNKNTIVATDDEATDDETEQLAIRPPRQAPTITIIISITPNEGQGSVTLPLSVMPFETLRRLYAQGERRIDFDQLVLPYIDEFEPFGQLPENEATILLAQLRSLLLAAVLGFCSHHHYWVLGEEFVASNFPQLLIHRPSTEGLALLINAIWLFREIFETELEFVNPVIEDFGIDFWEVVERHFGQPATVFDVWDYLIELSPLLQSMVPDENYDSDSEEYYTDSDSEPADADYDAEFEELVGRE